MAIGLPKSISAIEQVRKLISQVSPTKIAVVVFRISILFLPVNYGVIPHDSIRKGAVSKRGVDLNSSDTKLW